MKRRTKLIGWDNQEVGSEQWLDQVLVPGLTVCADLEPVRLRVCSRGHQRQPDQQPEGDEGST
jgi:hypothetical protein